MATVKIFAAIFLLAVTPAVAQNDSVQYHDNAFESQWGSSVTNDNFRYAVRVTPPYYPAQIVGIRAWFRNAAAGSTFKWVVYTDVNANINGGVNQVYISSSALPNPAAGGVTDSAYMAYIDLTSLNIQLAAGDYYVGVTSTSGWQGLAIDNNPATNAYDNRQWTYTYVFNGTWQTLASQASGGQWGITSFFAPVTTGIENVTAHTISVSPNPAANFCTVVLPQPVNDAAIRIVSAQGQLVKEERMTGIEKQMDIAGLPAGIYFIVIQNEQQTFTARLLRQ